MKYAVLSFDDGRADTYEKAYKILKKYGLTATINAVTDFIALQRFCKRRKQGDDGGAVD